MNIFYSSTKYRAFCIYGGSVSLFSVHTGSTLHTTVIHSFILLAVFIPHAFDASLHTFCSQVMSRLIVLTNVIKIGYMSLCSYSSLHRIIATVVWLSCPPLWSCHGEHRCVHHGRALTDVTLPGVQARLGCGHGAGRRSLRGMQQNRESSPNRCWRKHV